MDRPNVLFLFPEDMRADCISAYGNPHIRAPELDNLVNRGFSFRQNYCAGANSGAVCVPSRAMLMTGKPWFHIDDGLTKDCIFPELMREQGYATFITGKWHNGDSSVLRGFEYGQSLFLGGMSDHTRVPVQDISDGEFINRRFGNKFSSELFADSAIEFLESYNEDAPFFAYCAFTAPHDPRQPPRAYVAEYYDNPPPLPPNFSQMHEFDNGNPCATRDEELAGWPRTESIIRDQLAEYYGMITHLDEQLGRILRSLEHSPHANNTIVILAVDHGLAIGSHGLLGKQNIYEHSMHVPLLFAGPNIPSGESHALTYLLDVFPTICSLTGTTLPDDLFGHDLQPIWGKKRDAVRASIFLPYRNLQRSVRNERWKLHCYPEINLRLLFDLQNDPHEMEDLANQPEHRSTVREMLQLMKKCQEEFGDELPLSTSDPKSYEWEPICKRTPDRWQPQWIRDKYFGGSTTSEQSIKEENAEILAYGG